MKTPSGNSKELLTEGKIICVDMDGKVLEGELAPTSETPMHTICYTLRDDVESVVHCHAPYCTAFAQANMAYDDPASPEFQILFGKVPSPLSMVLLALLTSLLSSRSTSRTMM